MDSPSPISFRAVAASGAYRAAGVGVNNSRAVNPLLAKALQQQAANAKSVDRALIAGEVDSPLSTAARLGDGFDNAPSATQSATTRSATAPAAFALYSRAADKIEVATQVSLGRTLDAKA